MWREPSPSYAPTGGGGQGLPLLCKTKPRGAGYAESLRGTAKPPPVGLGKGPCSRSPRPYEGFREGRGLLTIPRHPTGSARSGQGRRLPPFTQRRRELSAHAKVSPAPTPWREVDAGL